MTLPEYTVVLLWLAATMRAIDFIFSVGTTETSANTFIKKLPDKTQLSVITATNAGAYPVSYGAAGAIIIALQLWASTSLTPVLVVLLLVCVAWVASAYSLKPHAGFDSSTSVPD